jgi:YD repeat-containing protein
LTPGTQGWTLALGRDAPLRPTGGSMQFRSALRGRLALALAVVCVSHSAIAVETKHIDVTNGFYMVDGVNIRNGNFAVTFNHFVEAGPGAIKFNSTYNSRSTHDGYFGKGWGSPFETRLAAMPDGTVHVRENGTGSLTIYGEPNESSEDGIELIVATAAGAKPMSDSERKQLTQALAADGDLQFDKIVELGVGLEVPEGARLDADRSTTFIGESCEDAYVKRSRQLYWRHCDDVAEGFNRDGRITRKHDGDNDAYLDMAYRDDQLHEVSLDDASLTFKWDGGHVVSVTDETGGRFDFAYDARGNLTREAGYGRSSDFAYDDRDNMTSMTFNDKSKQEMTYDASNRTTSVTRRDGHKTRFEYQQDLANSQRQVTKVTQYASDGSVETITVFDIHPAMD